MVALLLALLVGPATASLARESRLAMGTVVGITVIDAPPGAAEAAYAAIEEGEAALSEWREGSLTARLGRGEALLLPADTATVFVFAEALRLGSGGLFNLGWRSGARLQRDGEQWRASGPLDLGGLLKGYLVDQAARALRARGVDRFLIDAAGDLYAAGDGPRGAGWWVMVEGPRGPVARVRLKDQALSTSGDHQQPGHIHRADTGAPVTGDRLVSVVAQEGLIADGLATALFAGAPLSLAVEQGAAAWVSQDGASQTVGPARTFRRP